MQNPDISVKDGCCVLINKGSRHLRMIINAYTSSIQLLVCNFMENDDDLYAAVIAPQEERICLARRIVSFLGAYIRIENTEAVEDEILSSIETCLHNLRY